VPTDDAVELPTSPRWQRRPEARPEEILDAAREVFSEYGYAGAKLEDVARRAGVSKGTVYLYFDSKETLFREMVRAKVVAALAQAEAVVRDHQGPCRELLVLVVTGMYRRMRQEQMVGLSRVVLAELRNFPELAKFYFDEVILRARHLVNEVLARGVASGEFRPVTSQVQCSFHSFDPETLPDEAALEGLIDLYLNGVLAPPPSV
jgi:AcrR family transcriptional regulator